VLPAALGRYHRRHLSPHVASLVVSVVSAAVVGLFAIARLDPYRTLAASMVGLSTLGVLLLQAMAGVSVVVYFVRHPEMGTARTVVIPTVGATGLAAGFVLAAVHFSTLVGTDNRLVGNLPWLLGVVVVAGFGAGLWLRRTRPQPVPAHTAAPYTAGSSRTGSAQVTVALRRGGS